MIGGPQHEEMIGLQTMFERFMPPRRKPRRMPVRQARDILVAQEADRLIDQAHVTAEALDRVQNLGVVFIDELDKVAGVGLEVRAGCQPPGRPARPPAGRRRVHRGHAVRPRADRPHPLHRGRGVYAVEPVGPDAGTAGAVPDTRGTEGPDGGGVHAHPDGARQRPRQAAGGDAGDRRGAGRVHAATASRPSPRLPTASTSGRRTSARGGCTRSSRR